MTTSNPPTSLADLIDTTTITSLLSTVAILLIAHFSSLILLPTPKPSIHTTFHSPIYTALPTLRLIFTWHLFDALIHLLLEAPFVYHSIFSLATPIQIAAHKDSSYLLHVPWYPTISGADFSNAPLAKLWQEYAKADSRWGWGDPTTVAIELITAAGAGPLAAYICYSIVCLFNLAYNNNNNDNKNPSQAQSQSPKQQAILKSERSLYFLITILATCELYGGYMTFVPEWIVGSPHLNTSNWMYTWLYLFFFNGVWVAIPLWLVVKGWHVMVSADPTPNSVKKSK